MRALLRSRDTDERGRIKESAAFSSRGSLLPGADEENLRSGALSASSDSRISCQPRKLQTLTDPVQMRSYKLWGRCAAACVDAKLQATVEPRRASTECTGDGDDRWWDHGFDIRRRVGCGARQAAMQRGSTLSLHGWWPRLGTGDEWACSGIGVANAWRRRWGCC